MNQSAVQKPLLACMEEGEEEVEALSPSHAKEEDTDTEGQEDTKTNHRGINSDGEGAQRRKKKRAVQHGGKNKRNKGTK